MKPFKPILAIILSSSLLSAGADTPILLKNLHATFEQIKQVNQSIKLAVENLDQVKALNKTLDSVENGLDSMKLSIYNPIEGMKRIKRNAEALVNRMEGLGQRLANLTPQDFFRDDSDFQECLTMIQDDKGNQHATANEAMNPFWQNMKAQAESDKEENKRIHELTGIDLPTLQFKTCVDNKLQGISPQLMHAIEELNVALKSGDTQYYTEVLEKVKNAYKKVRYDQNQTLKKAIDEIRNKYAGWNSLSKDKETDKEKWQKALNEYAEKLKEASASKDGESINNLLLETNNILHLIATIQLNQYDLAMKANNLMAQEMLIANSELVNQEISEKMKEKNKNKKNKTISEYEKKLEKVELEFNELGVPIF